MAFSTMYIASTGLLALGTGMQTIGNNLANVNTVGFKAMRTNYEDLISECYFSGGNHNQVGRGAKVSTIQTIFNQGAFRSTEQDTDLAIAGEGFFNVRHRQTGEIVYTRAGSFTFRQDGYMEDPSGNILQGWQMSIPQAGQSAVRLGEPVDIQITTANAPPVATGSVRVASNLNADDSSVYDYDLYGEGEGAGYAGAWDARQSPAMDQANYTHSEPITVYDDLGQKHTLMTYYQKNPHLPNVWDYIVTSDPVEDARLSGGEPLYAQGASFAGLVQKGQIYFSGDDEELGHGGIIQGIKAQNLDLANSLAATVDQPAEATIGGYYTGPPNIDPATGEQTASERTYTLTWGYYDPETDQWSDNAPTSPPTSAITWRDDQGNLGHITVSNKNYPGPYNFGEGLTVSFDQEDFSLADWAAAGGSFEITARSEQLAFTDAALSSDGYFTFDLSFVNASGGLKPPYSSDAPATANQTVALNLGAKNVGGDVWAAEEVSTTQYAAESSTVANDQDGFPESSLRRTYVRSDGMVVGVYGEKREQELYQICLTRFMNPWGLDKRGDNLFAASRFSGEGRTSAPGEGGAGEVLGSFLEQSTVDTATEIVSMILTQRGFQANSKAITTNDAMLATAIQTKK